MTIDRLQEIQNMGTRLFRLPKKEEEEILELARWALEKGHPGMEEAVDALLNQHADIGTYYEVSCIPTEQEVMQSFNSHKNAREILDSFPKGAE
jgi:hypothetical protein